jgi:hypothetical protein
VKEAESYKAKKDVKEVGHLLFRSYPKEQCFESFQTLPACPYKNSVKMKMSAEHWWNDTEKGNPN